MSNENNAVKTYNLSGKFISESHHATAEEAYQEYVAITENLKNHLPKGHGVMVVRERYGRVQALEKIIGTK